MKSTLISILIGFSLFLSACGGGDSFVVVSTVPAAADVAVEPTDPFEVVFNFPVDPIALDGTMFTVAGGAGAYEGIWNFDDLTNTATYIPRAGWLLTDTVTVTLTAALAAVDGSVLGADYVVDFTVRDGDWEAAPMMIETDPALISNNPVMAFDADGNGMLTGKIGSFPNIASYRWDAPTGAFGPLVEIDPNNAVTSLQPKTGMLNNGDALNVFLSNKSGTQEGYVARYTGSSGSWGTPERVSTAGLVVNYIYLASSQSGDAIVSYAENPAAYSLRVSHLNPSGTWAIPRVIDSLGTIITVLPIQMDPTGNAFLSWGKVDATTFARNFVSRYDKATDTWSAPLALDSGTSNTGRKAVAVNDNGDAVSMWVQVSGAVTTPHFSLYDKTSDTWSAPYAVPPVDTGSVATASWLANYVPVGMDSAGNVIAVWPQNSTTPVTLSHAWAVRYDKATATWEAPVQLETNPSGHARYVAVGVDKLGNAVTTWIKFTGSIYNVWGTRYNATAGTWSTARLLENDDTGDTIHSGFFISPNGGGFAIWTQIINGNPSSLHGLRFK